MKNIFTTTIITTVVFGLSIVPHVFAQSQEELEAQLATLQQQVLALLQARLVELQGYASTTEFSIPSNHQCAIRYAGDSSITTIQAELQNQGYAITKVDGIPGPETTAAVTAFQTHAGAAKVDGIIGQETRTLLSRESVVCKGDAGAVVSEQPANPIAVSGALCTIRYQGDSDTMAVQQELQNQGYAITKVDGLIGSETTGAVSALQTDAGLTIDGVIRDEVVTALARRSVTCASLPAVTSTTVMTELPPLNETSETESTTETVSADVRITKTNSIAGVRSTTAGIPDDTAVFTYLVTFVNSNIVYVPTNPGDAFDIDLIDAGTGVRIALDGVDSVISSAQKVLREDGTSYFQVTSGDTMSLRTSVQPGEGSYYAELARLSYTNDDAFTVVNPSMVSYGFDGNNWRSDTVTLLN